ncbi:NUDIX hydrolase [Streptomyces sp. CHD11]|nr:NUDIX hydrolase [Streptomyces sp. CHD11]
MNTNEQGPERPERARPAPRSPSGAGLAGLAGAGRVPLGLGHDGRWEPPGGKVDPGVSFETAAARRGSHLGTPSARDRRGGSADWLPGDAGHLVLPCS